MTPNDDFVLKNSMNVERFCFSVVEDTLYIRVQQPPTEAAAYTFIVDRGKAKQLRNWLSKQFVDA